ncbi:hypothetical protein BaRGS_00008309 [Batillaria attramentaria]|uniref:Uncharacterized protein n=1 Tax=Batillaria attramentaria TaxID=370345 RepID=A0ABD0LLF5_9CAEN
MLKNHHKIPNNDSHCRFTHAPRFMIVYVFRTSNSFPRNRDSIQLRKDIAHLAARIKRVMYEFCSLSDHIQEDESENKRRLPASISTSATIHLSRAFRVPSPP